MSSSLTSITSLSDVVQFPSKSTLTDSTLFGVLSTMSLKYSTSRKSSNAIGFKQHEHCSLNSFSDIYFKNQPHQNKSHDHNTSLEQDISFLTT